MRPRRVFGYIRVSGEDQGRYGTSLEGQRQEIERYCRARGYPAPTNFVEVEGAGDDKIERRVELNRLLTGLRENDLVLVTYLDRWSRDIPFAVSSVRSLIKQRIGWYAVLENMDPSTPEGDDMLGYRAVAADQERKRIYRRTVGRRKQLRDAGLWAEGPTPYGYRRGKDRKLVVEPSEAQVVKELFERCVGGESLRELAAWFTEVRKGAFDRARVLKILRARWYLGEIRSSTGHWFAAHTAIVSRRQFDRAQEALKKRRLTKTGPEPASPRTSSWLLRGGLAFCGVCGRRIGAAYGSVGRGRRPESIIDYYACNGRLNRSNPPSRAKDAAKCSLPFALVQAIDAQVEAMTLERLRELRHELAKGPALPKTKPKASVDPKKIADRKSRLLDMAEKGLIDTTELQKRLERLDKEISKHAAELEELARAEEVAKPAVRRAALAQMKELEKAWQLTTVAERRKILSYLAARIELAPQPPPDKPRPVITWRTIEELVTLEVK